MREASFNRFSATRYSRGHIRVLSDFFSDERREKERRLLERIFWKKFRVNDESNFFSRTRFFFLLKREHAPVVCNGKKHMYVKKKE